MSPDELLTLFFGALLGAGVTGICWAIDRWRSRPYLTEDLDR